MNTRNLTLLTDLYELTMMQGYFETQENETVIFDVFFRNNPNNGGYSIMAGLDQVIDYIKNLNFSYEDVDYLRGLGIFSEDFLHYLSGFHFSGDIYAIPEGSVIFPKEPLLKIVAPIMEAQLVETAILNIINHQCLIATKASRVVYAAQGDGIMEFGLRRAQGPDAGLYGARAAMIGGCVGTSNVLAGQMFDVPVIAYDSTAIPGTLNGSGILLEDKDPVFVAGCIDRVVRDKNLRQQMIEGERKRLKDFEYDSIAAMFKNYLNAFINRTK